MTNLDNLAPLDNFSWMPNHYNAKRSCPNINCLVYENMHSKTEGKDQESIQSSTTPDPGYHVDFNHMLSLLHVVMSSVISHTILTSPPIQWSYICIFMNIYEIEKKRENRVKTIRGWGSEVRWLIIRPCSLRIFSHSCQIVKWGLLNEKQVVIKKKPVLAM